VRALVGVAVMIFWARSTRLLFPPVDGARRIGLGVQTLVGWHIHASKDICQCDVNFNAYEPSPYPERWWWPTPISSSVEKI
jgi:hypothetical protein